MAPSTIQLAAIHFTRAYISDIENSRSRDRPRINRPAVKTAGFSSPETSPVAANPQVSRHFSECRKTRGKAPGGWLGFLDAFRTICIDSKGEIQSVFEEMRSSCQFAVWDGALASDFRCQSLERV